VWRAVELPYIEDVAFVLQYSRFVVIDIKIVRGREKSHDGREAGGSGLTIHAVADSIVSEVKFKEYKKLQTRHLEPRVHE
jgi:hypothetical protein